LSLQSVSPQVAGSGVITLIGSAFGLENPNPSVRIGSTACVATLWQSWTQMLCYISPGSGMGLNVSVTIFDRTVYMISVFSYPPPTILSIFPRSIPSVGSFITITGSNFGTNHARIAVYANGSPCSSLILIASNMITCLAAAGSGANRRVSVDAEGQLSVVDSLSYDPPSMYSVDPALMPANLDFKVTVTGSSLGFAALSFLLLNFSADAWPFPIVSRCTLQTPHIALACFVSTASIPSEKTENGYLNTTALISVDSQSSASLTMAILPRSSLARLNILDNPQFSSTSFSDQLIGLLAAPSSCSVFVRNTTYANPQRRLLLDSVVIDIFVISRRSNSEAQQVMDNLGFMWSSNSKPLQSIGIIGATFENVIPVISPPGTSSATSRVDTKSTDSLPVWFVPAISVLFGSISLGVIVYFASRKCRSGKSASFTKTSSLSTSYDSASTSTVSTNVDDNLHGDEEIEFVSVQIDETLTSNKEPKNSEVNVVGVTIDQIQNSASSKGNILSQDVGGHQSAADAHVNIEMSLKDAAGERRALGNYLDAAAAQASCAQENELAHCHEDVRESEALYLGVALEEQCVCEWSGLRIPAVLCGMLTALSTPVDVMLEALSGVAAVDDGAAAMVFAELESLCVGQAEDAEAVCGAIVSKRSVHGAGLDIGLLRLWLRRLPDSVSFESVSQFLVIAFVFELCLCTWLMQASDIFVCTDCADCDASSSC